MVVHDLNVKYLPLLPAKADPPLIIDADAVLALAVAFEGFEPVAGRNLEILQPSDLMQKQELATGDSFNGPEPRHVLIVKQGFRPAVVEGADHRQIDYYAMRNMSNDPQRIPSCSAHLTQEPDGSRP